MNFSQYNPDVLEQILHTQSVTDNLGNTTVEVDDKILIPMENIEEDGIEVKISYVSNTGIIIYDEVWKETKNILDSNISLAVKQYLVLNDLETEVPIISFNSYNINEYLRSGSTIKVNALVSKGEDGVGDIYGFEPAVIGSFDPQLLEVSSTRLIKLGKNDESLESIVKNAQGYHNAIIGHIVTKPEYKGFCNKIPYIEDSNAWGSPLKFNKARVFLSFIPIQKEITSQDYIFYNNATYIAPQFPIENRFLVDDLLISNPNPSQKGIFDLLNEKILIYKMRLVNFHPLWVKNNLEITIYNDNLLLARGDMDKSIIDILINMFKNSLVYETEYIKSNVIKQVDQYIGKDMGVEIKNNTYIQMFEANRHEGNFIFYLDFPNADKAVYNFAQGIPLDFSTLPVIEHPNFQGLGEIHIDFSNGSYNYIGIREITYNLYGADFNRDQVVFGGYLESTFEEEGGIYRTIIYAGSTPIGIYEIVYDGICYVRITLDNVNTISPATEHIDLKLVNKVSSWDYINNTIPFLGDITFKREL